MQHLSGNGVSISDLKKGEIEKKDVHGGLESELKVMTVRMRMFPHKGHYIDSQKYPQKRELYLMKTPKSQEEKFFEHNHITHIFKIHTFDLRKRAI